MARKPTHEELVQRSKELLKANEEMKKEIEEHKRTEKTLRESEEKYRILVETMNDGLGMTDINNKIDPYIDKLRKSGLDEKQKVYVDILYSNFNDIISPFSRNLSRKFLSLTPRELLIANLVKQGLTTREIANLFSIAKKTIDVHRDNIRKKIGIKNKKANLRTHLLSFH